MVAPDCSGHPLWRGEKRQHDGKDTQSNWRSPPRPAAKSAEQGSRITGAPRKSVEDERVLEGPIVARKRGNTCGAKGPCCLSWFSVCQLDVAHFDALIWPPLRANEFSGAGRSGALRRAFCGALGRSAGRRQRTRAIKRGPSGLAPPGQIRARTANVPWPFGSPSEPLTPAGYFPGIAD